MILPQLLAASTPRHLPNQEVFAWGAVGALMALLAVQGLPIFRALANGELDWQPTLGRSVGVLAFIAAFVSLGGAVAMFLGDATEAKHAISYGLGWQAILGGFIKGYSQPGNP